MLNTPVGWLLLLVWILTVAAFLLRLDTLKLVILCILLTAAVILLLLRGPETPPVKAAPTVLVSRPHHTCPSYPGIIFRILNGGSG